MMRAKLMATAKNRRKRKKKPLPPRRLRMRREQRLQSAPKFITGYRGKRIVLGYARWFGVDRHCAIHELRLLGVEVPASEDEAARNAVLAAQMRRQRRKDRLAAEAAARAFVDPDDDFMEEPGALETWFDVDDVDDVDDAEDAEDAEDADDAHDAHDAHDDADDVDDAHDDDCPF
jgi:hypothetical protein